jgi:penicillin-binding protein 1C
MLGPDSLFERLQAAGLKLQESAGYHGLALALGSADVTLLDLANAYRMLARQGLWSPVRAAAADRGAAPASGRRVFDAGAAFLVADMLADPAARAITFGLDSALVTRGWAAVKTGTSKDMRDNWCIGFTPRYTVGVWVGNAGGAPMHGVSGVSGAAPVWRELMAALHASEPARAPLPPPGLVAQSGEWYLAGTEPRHASTASVARLGITSPNDGNVIALDPEIPPSAQRLRFEGPPGQWWLDGRLLGHGPRLDWLPRPGRHRLELRHAEGRDQIGFEVRAATAPRLARAR